MAKNLTELMSACSTEDFIPRYFMYDGIDVYSSVDTFLKAALSEKRSGALWCVDVTKILLAPWFAFVENAFGNSVHSTYLIPPEALIGKLCSVEDGYMVFTGEPSDEVLPACKKCGKRPRRFTVIDGLCHSPHYQTIPNYRFNPKNGVPRVDGLGCFSYGRENTTGQCLCHSTVKSDLCPKCRYCKERCQCQKCACGKRADSVCAEHRVCPACCPAPRCVGCTRHVTCTGCNGCDRHCSCSVEESARYGAASGVHYTRITKPTFHAGALKDFKVNRINRFIACEVEVAGSNEERGAKVNKVVAKWGMAVVSDGSLPSGGYEINMAPASGDLFLEEAHELGKALADARAFANEKCGLHTHVDCRDYSYAEMRRLALLWEQVEPAMFRLVSDARRGNSYCFPCGWRLGDIARTSAVPKKVKQAVRQKMYELSPNHISKVPTDKYHAQRYSAMNIHSWFVRGTVECRLGEGAVDGKTIANWALIVAAIVDWAGRHSDNEFYALPVITAPTNFFGDRMPSSSKPRRLRQSFAVLLSVLPKGLHQAVRDFYSEKNDGLSLETLLQEKD